MPKTVRFHPTVVQPSSRASGRFPKSSARLQDRHHRSPVRSTCLPKEVMTGELADGKCELYAEVECATYPAYRTRGARGELGKTADYLIQAERPIIIAGGGQPFPGGPCHHQSRRVALDSGRDHHFRSGIIADDHRLALGVIGDNGFHPTPTRLSRRPTSPYVGCKMGSVPPSTGRCPPASRSEDIQVDLNPEMLGNNFQNTLSVAGRRQADHGGSLVLIQAKTIRRTESHE